MSELIVSDRLQGDYGELVFQHFCQKNLYAYVSLEQIYNTLTPQNILTFRYGYHRIKVKLNSEVEAEIRRICRPSNEKEHQPSFVYDFLTVSLRNCFRCTDRKWVQISEPTKLAFNWVEIKTGRSRLTPNQLETKKALKLPLCVFRIHAELTPKITIDWEN
jgi:hypothetical protein